MWKNKGLPNGSTSDNASAQGDYFYTLSDPILILGMSASSPNRDMTYASAEDLVQGAGLPQFLGSLHVLIHSSRRYRLCGHHVHI